MKKIVLIACGSKKLKTEVAAEKLYISSLFKKNLGYAKSLSPDLILILSAKHGVLPLNQRIYPYDKTLNKMNKADTTQWANQVLLQLEKIADLDKDTFIFLAGDKYRKYLLPKITHHEIPMAGLRIGEQLRWLTNHLTKTTEEIR